MYVLSHGTRPSSYRACYALVVSAFVDWLLLKIIILLDVLVTLVPCPFNYRWRGAGLRGSERERETRGHGRGERRRERERERDVHAKVHERDTWLQKEKESHARERERERAHVAQATWHRVCPLYRNTEHSRRSKKAEWQVVTRHYRVHTLPLSTKMSADRWGQQIEGQQIEHTTTNSEQEIMINE